jgi:hypothetical protein
MPKIKWHPIEHGGKTYEYRTSGKSVVVRFPDGRTATTQKGGSSAKAVAALLLTNKAPVGARKKRAEKKHS